MNLMDRERRLVMKKKIVLYVAAGIAALMFAREIPAMIRYYKMTRM